MLRKLTISAMLVALALIGACAKPNPAYPVNDTLTLLKQIAIVGNPLDICFTSSHIFIAQDQGGVSIIDADTYDNRWLTSMVSHDGSTVNFSLIRKIAAVGEHNRLFINETAGADEIKIVDIADMDSLNVIDSITGGTYDIQDLKFFPIANPTGTDVIETIFCTRDVVSYGKYNGALWLGTDYNISPPGYASGVDLSQAYIFVAAQQRGLLIYDRVTRQKVSETSIPGEALKVKIAGNYAYIASRQGGLNVVNITNPQAPILTSTYNTSGYATTIDVRNNLAVVSSGSGGVYLFDLSSPGNPSLRQRLGSIGYTNNAKFYNNKLIVASRDDGILIYAIE